MPPGGAGIREAFIREVASELTWKAEGGLAKQVMSEGNSTGNCMCKMHVAGSETMSDSVWWEQRTDRGGTGGGGLGQVN